MKRNLVFHAGCPDGFGAAWAAWQSWGDVARYIARGHEDPFDASRFEGELVVFADISLRNAMLLELSEIAAVSPQATADAITEILLRGLERA